jgi:hypothetical protein
MVLFTFVILYSLCATVLLLAVAQDRRRHTGVGSDRGSSPPAPNAMATGRHEFVFTTHH